MTSLDGQGFSANQILRKKSWPVGKLRALFPFLSTSSGNYRCGGCLLVSRNDDMPCPALPLAMVKVQTYAEAQAVTLPERYRDAFPPTPGLCRGVPFARCSQASEVTAGVLRLTSA